MRKGVQLITYPDSLGENLSQLQSILTTHLKSCLSGVHILPFYPSSGDRGFSPLTYREPDPRFGSWEDVEKIAGVYHEWRKAKGKYEDVKGFCNSATVERVKELDYVLTPGRYVGLPDDEDDFDFKERFGMLTAEFAEQVKEEERLNALISENLGKVKIDG